MKKIFKTLCLCTGIAALGLFGLAGCGTDDFSNAEDETIANYIEFVDTTSTYDLTNYKISISMIGMEYEVTYTESKTARDGSDESYITTITALVDVNTPEYTFGSDTVVYSTSCSYYLVLSDEETEGTFSGSLYSYVGGETTLTSATSLSDMAFATNEYTGVGYSDLEELLSIYIQYDDTNMIQNALEAEYIETNAAQYEVKKLENTSDDSTTVKYQVKYNSEAESGEVQTLTLVSEFKNDNFVSYSYVATYDSDELSLTHRISVSEFTDSIETPDFVTEYDSANAD